MRAPERSSSGDDHASVDEILAHADELAARFEHYEPVATDERDAPSAHHLAGGRLPSMTSDDPVAPAQSRSMGAEARLWEQIERDRGLLTPGEVAAMTGVTPSQAVADAAAGRTLAVVIDGELRWPRAQFDGDGTVAMIVPELIAVAESHGRSRRGLVAWLHSPTTYLPGGRRPVEVLHSDPQAVLAAAAQAWGVEW